MAPDQSFAEFIGYRSPFSLENLGRPSNPHDMGRKLLANRALEHPNETVRNETRMYLELVMMFYLSGRHDELRDMLTRDGLRDPNLTDEDPV